MSFLTSASSAFLQFSRQLRTSGKRSDKSLRSAEFVSKKRVRHLWAAAKTMTRLIGIRRVTTDARKAERQSALRVARSGAVVTTIAADAADAPPVWKQGNLSTYDDDKLSQRHHLRHNEMIHEVIDMFWDVASEGGLIKEESYQIMNRGMYRALIEDFVEEECYQSTVSDWEYDRKGKPRISLQMFHSSMFELADVWTDEISDTVYRDFLLALFYRIAHRNADGTYSWKREEDIRPLTNDDFGLNAAWRRLHLGHVFKKRQHGDGHGYGLHGKGHTGADDSAERDLNALNRAAYRPDSLREHLLKIIRDCILDNLFTFREIFDGCDTDGDGAIGMQDFVIGMHKLGVRLNASHLQQAFKFIDEFRTYRLKFPDFVSGLRGYRERTYGKQEQPPVPMSLVEDLRADIVSRTDLLLAMFYGFDPQRLGWVGKAELKYCLEQAGVSKCELGLPAVLLDALLTVLKMAGKGERIAYLDFLTTCVDSHHTMVFAHSQAVTGAEDIPAQ
eukprot:TRINITY_DN11512_c0_g1_i1.p1 TRINITY_DN11512_c0_g1~~TRINITY_DN11512_c0_g1_i1.p1  ORF type:complete len:503 (+),score=91.09 TRINITY_DN11512_c0_g1_i1:94-1602(+)